VLFKALKEGGFYVIEDLGNSYIDLNTHNLKQNWPGMRYNKEDDFENRIEEIHEFTNRIVEEIDQLSSLNLSFGRYTYLHRYKWVMVIKK
jgi:HEPN domain-containing protein